MPPPYLSISVTALLLTPGTRKRPPQSGSVQTMLMGGFRRILLHVLPCRITPELSNTEFPDSKIEVAA
jgi:hypothetical protein